MRGLLLLSAILFLLAGCLFFDACSIKRRENNGVLPTRVCVGCSVWGGKSALPGRFIYVSYWCALVFDP